MREDEALISQMLENAYQQGFTKGQATILSKPWTRKETLTTATLFIVPLVIVTLTFLARM